MFSVEGNKRSSVIERSGKEEPKLAGNDLRQMETTAMRSPPKEKGLLASVFGKIGTFLQRTFFPTSEQKFEKAQESLNRHVADLGKRLADYRVSEGGTNAVFGILRNIERMRENGSPTFNHFIALQDAMSTLPDSVTEKLHRLDAQQWDKVTNGLKDLGEKRSNQMNDRQQALHEINPGQEAPPPPKTEEGKKTAEQIGTVVGYFRTAFGPPTQI